ncbi:MAG: UvrD-helicase domain-containing protein [Syntrophomonas sp.]
MFNPREEDEIQYLNEILEKLHIAFENIGYKIANYSSKILDAKRYIYENLAELDKMERIANRMAVYEDIDSAERAARERTKLQKLIQSPYFGRIDFKKSTDLNSQPLYIGIHPFLDPHNRTNIVFDWRAPISSMFYDFELGAAFYTAPTGKIDGTINLKRQYRIRRSHMEFMIESSLTIGDDILQKELSQNADQKMKNIVSTIQREQNAIIRNEAAKVLIIQGVAGSGKTSIALHRVAFLLYRHRDKLTSNNILIISPNKVFGSYIANVLPELGEENILETSFEDIAEAILDKKYKYQIFSQQIESLLDLDDQEAIARIEYKASNSFVEQLQAYLEYACEEYFVAADLDVDGLSESKENLLSYYRALKGQPFKVRLELMATDLIKNHERNYEKKIDAQIARQIRKDISRMFKYNHAFSLYKDFYRHINRTDLFRLAAKDTFEFCDVYPYVYVKLSFDGIKQDYSIIKHLLVDEMQDYTPIQYAVLTKLFSCPMTILGDSNQSVNPYSSSTVAKIRPFFRNCACMELCKSYRSTIEITRFASKIQESKNLIPVERHGDEPNITFCDHESRQIVKIQSIIEQFKQSAYTSLAIICKSQKRANQMYEKIRMVHKDVLLVDFNSNEFQEGVTITYAHMAKGLEFDQVIVPDASADWYKTEFDRNLLYIACTRAMHKLELTCCGAKSRFLTE